MKQEKFEQLIKSVRQMGEIKKGKKLAGMRTTYRPQPTSPKEIQKVRKDLRMTQERFAHVVGTSPSAIKHWEQGIRTPTGAAAQLIRVLKSHPELVGELA